MVKFIRLEYLEQFLKNYIREVALPNPENSLTPYILPNIFCLRDLYSDYIKKQNEIQSNIQEEQNEPVSWGKFHEFWNENFKYCKKLNKRTDFCETCCQLRQAIKDNTSPKNQLKAKEELENHLMLAREARNAYNEHLLKTAMEDHKVVLSFDFAESVLLPFLKDTPSSFYFKTRRKVDIFGITDEQIVDRIGNIQTNYIIDEGHRIPKGPESTISMIHHYLTFNVPPDTSLIFYSDNCPGQNKNQYLIGFFVYLVKVLKLYPSI